MIIYRAAHLHKNSKAYELFMQWQKSQKPEDKKVLDQHMKEIEAKYDRTLK